MILVMYKFFICIWLPAALCIFNQYNRMLRLSILLTLILCSRSVIANTYYLSSTDGQDSRSASEAQNSQTPWKSLDRLNAFIPNLLPGDSVLFKCNDTFTGQINIVNSGSVSAPFVFSSYGEGSKPIISGLEELKDWEHTSDGIWRSVCNNCKLNVNSLFVNGKSTPVGRYPNVDAENKGFLTIQSHNRNTEITDTHLAEQPNWTGGEVVMRKNRWILDKHTIVNHRGSTLMYNGDNSNYWPSDNYGYFIQNHPATLDLNGEWCYQADGRAIFIKTGTTNPADLHIGAAFVDTLLLINFYGYMVIDNLSFYGANKYAAIIFNSDYVTIRNCDFIGAGIDGIHSSSNRKLVLENNLFEDSHNDGIVASGCLGCLISANTIRRSGVVRGMGGNGDDAYQGLIVRGIGNRITYNTIDSTGYTALRFEGDSVLVKNNFIDHFVLVKDDGGGIYTWQAGDDNTVYPDRSIEGNIIQNGIGDGSGTLKTDFISANGIYVDGHAGDLHITGNTILNCSLGGMFFNNPHNIFVQNNKVFNNGKQLYMGHIFASAIGNNAFNGNMLVSKAITQNILEIESEFDDIQYFANYDKNYYCRPVDDNVFIRNTFKRGDKTLIEKFNLEDWQLSTGKDQGTLGSPVTYPYYSYTLPMGENKFPNGSFESNFNGVYTWSPEGYSKLKWTKMGQLDAGQLELSFEQESPTSNISFTVIGIGSVVAGQTYHVTFSLAGVGKDKHYELFLRQSYYPYQNVSTVKDFMGTADRFNGECIFTALTTEENASIVITLEEQKQPIYIDNISMQEADVKIDNLDEKIIQLINPSTNRRSLSLDGTFMDPASTTYSGSITLEPYGSAILFKQPVTIAVADELALSGNKAEDAVQLQWDQKNNSDVKVYEIQRSQNGTSFTTIGSVPVNSLSTPNFSFTDYCPLDGNNFYRIRSVKNKGTQISKSLMLKTSPGASMKLSPNPAQQLLTVDLSRILDSSVTQIIIRSMTGYVLLKETAPANTKAVTINISKLVSGTYFISALSNNSVVSQKSFIKL